MCVPLIVCCWNATTLVKEIGLTRSGRSKVCHQDDTLFNCAVQVPHQSSRTRLSCVLPLDSFGSVLPPPAYPQAERWWSRGGSNS